MSRKLQATIVLIFMTAGMILTINEEGFILNLIHNGFLAAMIGGLADWFAVTAIFRKPLGISWRTAVIPKNRERIMDEIIHFVGEDLLNTDNIMKDIEKYDLAKMFLDYMDKNAGKLKLKETVHPLIIKIIQEINIDKIATPIAKVIEQDKHDAVYKEIAIKLLYKIINGPQFDLIIELYNVFLQKILADKKIELIIQAVLHDVREEYKEGSTFREMAISMFDLNDEKLAKSVKEKLLLNGEQLKNSSNKQRINLENWCRLFVVNNLEHSDKYDSIINDIGYKLIKTVNIRQKIETNIDKYKSTENVLKIFIDISDLVIDRQINCLAEDKGRQKRLDCWLKEKLNVIVKNNMPVLLEIVKDKLNSYSTESFVKLVEEHVDEDLQMIRINGSLVGGIAGMVLYTISYIVERICS
ncbi:DUF445 domain-containing protein [Pectinatus sottacetonis]|uniref:DUF445 domain-containing protein n=1 Tax=Pectinatus sottacetonis TaxID=1002795 RepID=UPI0018C7CDDC|nr:DUF445 domain-containing protein [Pectinatus sottacetonis]